MKRIPISLTTEQHAALEKLSTETGNSIASHVRSAISDYLARQETKMSSIHKQNIQQVARLMQESDEIDPTGGRTREEWARHNRDEGWSFMVRYGRGHQEPDSLIEGLVLSEADFNLAYQLKERWLSGESCSFNDLLAEGQEVSR